MSVPYVYIVSGCLDARDLEFKGVPDAVMVCPFCLGNGKRKQWYLEGRSTRPCDFCDVSGFVYKATCRGVPISVTNQIAVASGLRFRRFQTHGIDWECA